MSAIYCVIEKTINSIPHGSRGFWLEVLVKIPEHLLPDELKEKGSLGVVGDTDVANACGWLVNRAAEEVAEKRYGVVVRPRVMAGERIPFPKWGFDIGRVVRVGENWIPENPLEHFVTSGGFEVWLLKERPEAERARVEQVVGV